MAMTMTKRYDHANEERYGGHAEFAAGYFIDDSCDAYHIVLQQ